MTDTPVDFEAALLYARQQAKHLAPPPSYNISTWEGRCQQFVHTCYGLLTGGFGTAYAQWLGADSEDRHFLTDLDKAPVGSLLCTKGDNPDGHIFPASHPFASGAHAGWSNDLVQLGHIDKVLRTAPQTAWGHRPLGYITSVNGFALDLTHTKNPPKPKQNKPYQRINRAINNLEVALGSAQHDHDKSDIVAIKAEIKRLEDLYNKIKHS